MTEHRYCRALKNFSRKWRGKFAICSEKMKNEGPKFQRLKRLKTINTWNPPVHKNPVGLLVQWVSSSWTPCRFAPLLLRHHHHLGLGTPPRHGSSMESSPELQLRRQLAPGSTWVHLRSSGAGSSASYPPVLLPRVSRASLSFRSLESPWSRYFTSPLYHSPNCAIPIL